MRLAIILLLVVTGTHYGTAPLSLFYEDPTRAARALFYVARGMEGAVLFVLVGILVRRPVVWAVCFFGFIEEAQTSVCRVAYGIAGNPGPQLFSGLCGQNLYILGLIAALGLALYTYRETRK